jgi:hypothetical protein
MMMSKLLVGSTLTAAFLTAGTATAASTAPAKCSTVFERLNNLVVVTIPAICKTATTVAGAVNADLGKTATALAMCEKAGASAAKVTALSVFGPKSYNPATDKDVSGRTFLFGDRAFFAESAHGSDKAVVTLSRGQVKRFLSKSTKPSKGSANLRVCATSAADAADFKARKDATCECLSASLSETASSVSVTLDGTVATGLKDKRLFMVVDGLKGSLKFTLKVDTATAAPAAPTTAPAATTTTTTTAP